MTYWTNWTANAKDVFWTPVISNDRDAEAVEQREMPACCRRMAEIIADPSDPFVCGGCGFAWQRYYPIRKKVYAYLED